VRIDRIRDELRQLEMDEHTLALWARMPPARLRGVLEKGATNRSTIHRLRNGLRLAWVDKVGLGADAVHFSRVTMKYLSEEIA